MSTTTTQSVSLKINRLIKASRERIFDAWTHPNEIVKWLCVGMKEVRCLSAKLDPRVGGAYNLRFTSPEMGEFEMHGVYREVKRPERLVMTWNSSSSCGAGDGETLLTINLREKGNATELELIHEGFASTENRDRHDQGWNLFIDNLGKLME